MGAQPAAGHQRHEQLPAQVLVHGQPVQGGRAVQEPGNGVQLPGAAGQQGKRLHKLQLCVRPAGHRTGQVPEGVHGGHGGGLAVLLCNVEVQGGGQLAQLDQDH